MTIPARCSRYYDAWQRAGIDHGGPPELVVNALVLVSGFIEWERR